MKRNKQKAGQSSRKKSNGEPTFWMFGIHAIKNALMNEKRKKLRLLVSQNAFNKLKEAIEYSRVKYDIINTKNFKPPIAVESVHQGAFLEVIPLNWASVSEICQTNSKNSSRVILLDRVSDPQNVGAILRTSKVFGATAVISPHRHSPPETGSLAKSASGALEVQPYLRVPNLSRAISSLKKMNYTIVGFDASAKDDVKILEKTDTQNLALIFGSEGLGLRHLTIKSSDFLVKISSISNFSSLNVSNALAVGLYATSRQNN